MSDARVKKMCAYSKNPTAMAETLAQQFISKKIKPEKEVKPQSITASRWAEIINTANGEENVQSHVLNSVLVEGRTINAILLKGAWYLDNDVLLKLSFSLTLRVKYNVYVSLLVEDTGETARLTGITLPQTTTQREKKEISRNLPDLASQVVSYLNCPSGNCKLKIKSKNK